MKLLLEKWRDLISEEDLPQVTCTCLCIDCIFNKNKLCYAKNIDLDYASTDDGRTICECKTFKTSEDQE